MILHGLGATNSDFVPLATQLGSFSNLADKNILCIFPQAPSLNGINSWWDISTLISAFTTAVTTQNMSALATPLRAEPKGLLQNRSNLLLLLDNIIENNCLKQEGSIQVPLFIGGFSQGAMTALDLSLNLPKHLIFKNALNTILMSGAPIMIDHSHMQLKRITESNTSLNVIATHGTADFVIPVVANQWLGSLFQPFKGKVNFQNYQHKGGHELGGPDILQSIFSFIAERMR